MKSLLLIAAFYIIGSSCAFSQTTYLLDTAFATDIGYDGAEASCIVPHMRYFGWQDNRAQDTWLADVFTVPAGSSWVFDTVIIYGAQDHSGTTSTLLNCNLEIYDGAPGLGGSVIWGDTVTNILGVAGSSTGFTGIYKVDTFSSDGGLASNSSPVMYVKCYLSPAVVLSAGTYWLSWSLAGSGSYIPYSPNKVLNGRINPPGQMARQLFGGVWRYITDSGNNVGMNMIIKARAGIEAVPNYGRHPSATLNQNVPNPFYGSTDISYYLEDAGIVKLSVYNAIGQQVGTLTDGTMGAGIHHVSFNAYNLACGTYYYKLVTNDGIITKPMTLIK